MAIPRQILQGQWNERVAEGYVIYTYETIEICIKLYSEYLMVGDHVEMAG